MEGFSGFEPQVGEIRALRTFRVDNDGRLLPLYSRLVWHDGANTAVCARIGLSDDPPAHPAPDSDCRCGFYAYGSERAAAQHRNSRYVSAVVACWGRVIAGTRGVRAQYARIEAIYLAESAPPSLRRQIARRYPSSALYQDRATMLSEHPLSQLDCYHDGWFSRRWPGINPMVANIVQVAIIAMGLIPAANLRGSALLWTLWSVATAFVALVTVLMLSGVGGRLPRAAALGPVILMLWLVAPMSGTAAWLLRLPALLLMAVGLGTYLITRRRGYFPLISAVGDDRPPRRVAPKSRPHPSVSTRPTRPGHTPRVRTWTTQARAKGRNNHP